MSATSLRENSCLFCGIIQGDIPSYTWYEDDTFVAILDRFPKCPGHTLILPKAHAANLFDLPESTAARLLPLAQTLSKRLYEAFHFQGLNLLQNNGETAGQQVNHFHLHLIPRYDRDDMAVQWVTIDPTPADFMAVLEKLKA